METRGQQGQDDDGGDEQVWGMNRTQELKVIAVWLTPKLLSWSSS
jgi:hypothetical protein